jgi:hypothetical protein
VDNFSEPYFSMCYDTYPQVSTYALSRYFSMRYPAISLCAIPLPLCAIPLFFSKTYALSRYRLCAIPLIAFMIIEFCG